MGLNNTDCSYDDCPLGGCGNELEGCIHGSWYGYCTWEDCYGMCSYEGDCTCGCHGQPKKEEGDSDD